MPDVPICLIQLHMEESFQSLLHWKAGREGGPFASTENTIGSLLYRNLNFEALTHEAFNNSTELCLPTLLKHMAKYIQPGFECVVERSVTLHAQATKLQNILVV